MKIHWNWGTKIVIGLAAFMLLIVGFVIRMAMEDVSLVEKDYYPKGQAYQQLLDRVQNTVPYAQEITAMVENETLKVSFPGFFRPQAVTGNVHLYNRVSDKGDIEIALKLDDNSVFSYDASGLRGRYIIKIEWEQDGVEYYTEKKLTLE